MTERTSVLQSSQVGVETVPGTGVPALHRLSAFSIEPQPKIKTGEFTPQGAKHVTVTTLEESYAELKVTGVPTYTELQYLLATVIGNAVVTAGTDLVSQSWSFQPNTFGADAVASLTVETGDVGRAQRVSGCAGTELTLGWKAGNTPKADGTLVGGAIEDGVALSTGAVVTEALVPINLTEGTFYLDTAFVGIGTTKLTRCFDFEAKTTGRRKPFFVLDASLAGAPAGNVEAKSTNEVKLTLAADDAGMAFYNGLPGNATYYLRAEFVGGVVPTGTEHFAFTADYAVKVKDVSGLKDTEGVWGVDITLTIVEDGAGNNQHYTLVNAAATL